MLYPGRDGGEAGPVTSQDVLQCCVLYYSAVFYMTVLCFILQFCSCVASWEGWSRSWSGYRRSSECSSPDVYCATSRLLMSQRTSTPTGPGPSGRCGPGGPVVGVILSIVAWCLQVGVVQEVQ